MEVSLYYVCTYMHVPAHTHMHACTHAHMHARMHAHKHTHTHTHLFKVHIIPELHVLSVDAENLQAPGRVRDTYIHFTIKSPKSSQSWVNAVGAVCGCHHDNVGSLLESVHESEELRYNSPLHFTVCL